MTTVLVLVSCGGDEGSQLGEAFCNDLEAGAGVQQLYGAVEDEYTPEEFSARVTIWVEEDCPEQLGSNQGLRRYLKNWGFDPDNLPEV